MGRFLFVVEERKREKGVVISWESFELASGLVSLFAHAIPSFSPSQSPSYSH